MTAQNPVAPENHIPGSSILAQLEKILASAPFAQSDRMCRFLRMVVEYSLEKRSGELKEYSIALQVFDRKSSFDPRVDPIVRVEARRLRTKLGDYYEHEGRNDEIRIELQKGNYAARFSRRDAGVPVATPVSVGAREAAVAVIPFANLGSGNENDYFSDGLTQELILGLTRVPGLRVVAWTSAAQLRGEHDFQAIGKRLNVGAVLTGSVRKGGDRVRVTAQLIDTTNSSYLWSEAYDRQLEDLLQIQDDISRAIVGTLRIQLAGRFSFPALRRPTYNFEAHNLYLKGRFEWNRRVPDGLLKSVRFFEQAIELEPGFALGWAGLADCYTLLAEYGLARPEISMPEAKQAALKAVELDPSLGEAWTSLALVYGLYEWAHEKAEECFLNAVRLNPGYSTVHHWFAADHLAVLGRFEEAHTEIRLARMLDPWSTIIIEGEAYLLMLRGLYDEAIATSREALAIDPTFYKSWTAIGRVLIQKGQYAEAIEMLEKGRSLAGGVSNILGALCQAHALAGNTQKARQILTEIQAAALERPVPFTSLAIAHLGLGETDLALDALEQSCERRDPALSCLNVHPVYDKLRETPRCQALLRKMRLA